MKIAVHTIVKNEDKFLWFAISSVADFVDEIVIWDTGSTDKTLEIIKALKKRYPEKINFQRKTIKDPKEVTNIRQKMLLQNKADWIIWVDGDEIWWADSIKNLTDFIRKNDSKYDSCVVHYQNLVGDMYHYQNEKYGGYLIDRKKGFLTIRAFNTHIKGIHYKKEYPLEGIYDTENVILQEMNPKRRKHFDDLSYLHVTHLERSTKVHNKKFKFQLGIPLPYGYFYPESFFYKAPSMVDFPWSERSFSFRIKALLYDILRKLK